MTEGPLKSLRQRSILATLFSPRSSAGHVGTSMVPFLQASLSRSVV